MGIRGCQHVSKKKVFDAIANEKDNPTPKVKKEEAKITKNHVNPNWYFNVLFSDTICPKLALRGKSLSKEQMREGFKTDELFDKEIILEYNSKKDKHNELAHG